MATAVYDAVATRLIGQSTVIREVRALINRAAAGTRPVVVAGEPGTGKTLVAGLIHDASPRAAAPCIQLPFDAAATANLDVARGGTLILRDLELATPAERRRVEERFAGILGASQSGTERLDIRVVLTALSLEGHEHDHQLSFAGVSVFPISIPPLRERRADIPLLAEHFAEAAARERGLAHRDLRGIDMGALLARQWAENVTELKRWVEWELFGHAAPISREPEVDGVSDFRLPRNELWTLNLLERRYIEHVLALSRGNQSKAAERLGIDRRTLYRKLKEYRASVPERMHDLD